MRIKISAAIAVLALAGCATIVKGTSQSVAIITPNVQGASCTLTSEAIGTRTLVTPATITLEKSKDNINVVCKKACFQDGVGIVASHTEAMAAGNIIAGGFIGLGIDAASGAMNKYAAETSIHMAPIPGCGGGGANVASRRS